MMKKSDTALIGKKGERTAARYLKKHGYRILAKNQHFSHNELDLIAKSADFIAFIEVKARRVEEKELPYLRPAYAVDQGKRRRTAAAALDYLKQHPVHLPIRFDVIEVCFSKDRRPRLLRLTHIEDAFGTDGIHR